MSKTVTLKINIFVALKNPLGWEPLWQWCTELREAVYVSLPNSPGLP